MWPILLIIFACGYNNADNSDPGPCTDIAEPVALGAGEVSAVGSTADGLVAALDATSFRSVFTPSDKTGDLIEDDMEWSFAINGDVFEYERSWRGGNLPAAASCIEGVQLVVPISITVASAAGLSGTGSGFAYAAGAAEEEWWVSAEVPVEPGSGMEVPDEGCGSGDPRFVLDMSVDTAAPWSRASGSISVSDDEPPCNAALYLWERVAT